MTIAIREAPESVSKKFDRAMTILAAIPGQVLNTPEYHHIGPFPKRVLEAIPRSEADLASPYAMGWQYLVHDAEGYAVLDISNKPDGSYTYFRRGSFALGYAGALEAAEAAVANSPDLYELEIVDIPSAFTLIITMKSKELKLYPAFYRGKRLISSSKNFDDLHNLGEDDFHRDHGGPSPF